MTAAEYREQVGSAELSRVLVGDKTVRRWTVLGTLRLCDECGRADGTYHLAVCPCAKRRNKYQAIPTEVDGIRFASRLEARRYEVLRDKQRDGEIEGLELQVRHPIVINGIKVCEYVSDFEYRDVATGRWVVEDAKGMRTSTYRLKAKLMRAVHRIEIQEVR